MKCILVTGASGYVGRQCLAPLQELGFEVHGISRQPLPSAGVVMHGADILRESEWRSLLSELRPTHLLHLAWTTAHGAFWTDPANDAWLESSRRLVDSFIEAGGRRVITAGSCAEYDWTAAPPFSEAMTPCVPSTPYGRAKLALHGHTAARAVAAGLSHAHGRLFFSFGPAEQPGRLVPAVILSLAAGRPFEIKDAGALRDYLDVREIGRALALIAAADVTGAVNIGMGAGVTVGDLAGEIARIMERPSLLRLQNSGTVSEIVADTRRLDADVGFQNRIPLAEGLAFAVRWWRERNFAA
jgi:nucleoside-diphosphate-sugar epimerase